jgi:hypothetical protein
MVFLFAIVGFATIVHLFKFGEKEGAEEEVFKNSQQYEDSIFRRKKVWAQWVTIFSFPRMFN